MCRTQVFYISLLLNLCTWYNICNWAFLLRLLLIDCRDEYQLVSFLIASKAYHYFVYGVWPLFQMSWGYFDCGAPRPRT